MADQTVLNQTQQLLPEYQEEFLKNLLSNIYRVELDDQGNPLLDASGQPIVSGIAAESPLMGTPVFDEAGNPVYETDAEGNIRTDFRGNPIQVVEGGVVPPDVAPFVRNQLEAIGLAESGVGAFEPFFTDAGTTLTGAAGRIPTAAGMFGTGQQGLGATTGAYDTSGYTDYYTPFTEQVVGQTAGDVAQAMRDIGAAATTGATGVTGEAAAAQQGMRGAGAGIAGQVGGAQSGVAEAARAARAAAGTGATGITGAAQGIAPLVQQAATDVGQAARGARGTAATGAAGMRDIASGLPLQATGAQTAADIAAQRARLSSAQAQQDLATAGQFGLGAAAQGMQGLTGTTGQFDPSGIGSFMSPFEDAAVQQAIQDIARAGQIQQQGLRAQAVGAGAFGGSREAVAAQELGRNILEQQGRTAAQMRQSGFESAAQRAQQAFEAQQGRTQQAAQLAGALGQAGAGTAAQAAQAAGQLGLSAEQLAQTGALQGGQLGLSALSSQADIERAAAALGMTAEQLAQTGALQTGQLGVSGQSNIGSLLDAASRLGLSAEQLAQTGALQGGQLGLSGQTNLASILQSAGQMGMAGQEAAAQLGMTGAQQQAALSSNLANLRAAGFGSAQQLGQGAFENQMARGQTAAQIFGQLGQGLGNLANVESTIGTRQAALGEATQAAGQRDVNALFNIGALEQAQQQAEYDVQRAAGIEQAFEPFQRFNYMSDIFRGVPSTQSTLTATSVPTPSPVSSILGTAQGIANYQQATGQGILSGLV